MAMNPMHQVAVVIPFYRDILLEYEEIALAQCHKVLAGYPIIAIKPESLVLPDAVTKYDFFTVESFEDKYFEGIKGYNELMLSDVFYGRFLAYEYILIYQLDAFVFKDELEYWCRRGYDYIGAPWLRNKIYSHLPASRVLYYFQARFNVTKNGVPSKMQFYNKVGNGGFSLRRVKKFYELSISLHTKVLAYLSRDEHEFNEDSFWSIEVNRKKKNLKIPSYKTGLRFSIESYPRRAMQINHNRLPFGCHAWDIHKDFWRPVFGRFNYHI